MVAPRRIAGDQFTQEAGQEELHAHDHEGERHVKRADLGDVLGLQALTDGPELVTPNDPEQAEAHEEHQRPEHPKQVHRFVPEPTDEGDGQQIEEPIDESLQAEFG